MINTRKTIALGLFALINCSMPIPAMIQGSKAPAPKPLQGAWRRRSGSVARPSIVDSTGAPQQLNFEKKPHTDMSLSSFLSPKDLADTELPPHSEPVESESEEQATSATPEAFYCSSAGSGAGSDMGSESASASPSRRGSGTSEPERDMPTTKPSPDELATREAIQNNYLGRSDEFLKK